MPPFYVLPLPMDFPMDGFFGPTGSCAQPLHSLIRAPRPRRNKMTSVFLRSGALRGFHFLAAIRCRPANCRPATTFSRPLGPTKILRSPSVTQVQVPPMHPLAAAAAEASTAGGDLPAPHGTFSSLGLNAELQAALVGLNIQQPTEIQVKLQIEGTCTSLHDDLLCPPGIKSWTNAYPLTVQVPPCPPERRRLRPGLTHWFREDPRGEALHLLCSRVLISHWVQH
jgi:hypothetical protein